MEHIYERPTVQNVQTVSSVRRRGNAVRIAANFLIRVVALVGLLAVIALMSFVIGMAASAFWEPGLGAIASAVWAPTSGDFGLLPLVSATIYLALISTCLSLALSLPAAARLAFFAGAVERRVSIGCLTLLSGLPSIIVGLVGLFALVPVFGFSAFAGVITLTLMSWPTFALLLLAIFDQQGRAVFDTAKGLGIGKHTAVYRIALRDVTAATTRLASRIFAKSCGEATAVSFVIGNLAAPNVVPALFEPAHTLTTMILKDHGAASGEHLAVIYAAALTLGAVVLGISSLGAALARFFENKQILKGN